MRVTIYSLSLLLLLSLLPSDVQAQEAVSLGALQVQKPRAAELPPAARPPNAVPLRPDEEKHSRLFWIIPTYTVSNSRLPVSLTSTGKCRLFYKNTSDPFTLAYIAFSAAIQQANNDLPGYGQGAAGYGKRLGAGLGDEISSGFFQTYLFPSMLRQDPRYFRAASGGFKERLAHAIIRPVVTRKDSGGRAFNWSGILGLVAASGLSNAYYPATDRGVERTFKRVATGIPLSVIDHLIDEFGSDLEQKLLRRK